MFSYGVKKFKTSKVKEERFPGIAVMTMEAIEEGNSRRSFSFNITCFTMLRLLHNTNFPDAEPNFVNTHLAWVPDMQADAVSLGGTPSYSVKAFVVFPTNGDSENFNEIKVYRSMGMANKEFYETLANHFDLDTTQNHYFEISTYEPLDRQEGDDRTYYSLSLIGEEKNEESGSEEPDGEMKKAVKEDLYDNEPLSVENNDTEQPVKNVTTSIEEDTNFKLD